MSMRRALDHLSRFQVATVDGDGFRCIPALRVGHSVNVRLASDISSVGHLLILQAKKPSVIFRFRIIGEDHDHVALRGLHDQCFSGP
jgi:hypothetical protein